MNTQGKVNKMMFSNVNKFELALDGQLKEQGQKAQSIFNDGRRDALQEVLNATSQMKSAIKKLDKLTSDIDSAYERGQKTAKMLGVDLDSTTVGKNFKRAYNEVADYKISCQTAIDKLRKFSL